MWSNSVSIEIAAPPDKVFAYLADLTRHSEWSTNVRSIKLTSGTAGQVGAEYEAHESNPPNLTSFARVTDLRPPLLIRWESTDNKVFRTNWRFEITPITIGSRLTQSVTFTPLTFLARAILYLFRAPVVEKENRASLERIKAQLEK